MPLLWKPEPFISHLGVTIYHAYKDEFSDIPLDYWYSTNEDALPGSEYEFDIRDLRNHFADQGRHLDDKEVICLAIEQELLHENMEFSASIEA